jgi:hypothetical protein
VVWVADEFVARDRTVERNAQSIAARKVPCEPVPAATAEAPSWRPAWVYCDVAGGQVHSQTGKRDESVLRAAGFRVRSSAMEIEAGVALLNDLVDPAAEDSAGLPRLLVDPRCVQLITSFERYRRRLGGSPVKDGEHDHAIDALRYALVNHDQRQWRTDQRAY